MWSSRAYARCPDASRAWRVLPFRVTEGRLHAGGSRAADSLQMTAALRAFTALEIRFHLVTPSEYKVDASAAVGRRVGHDRLSVITVAR